jgi:malonyl-CoA O-methyltransferase
MITADVLLLPGWGFSEKVFEPLQQALESSASTQVISLPENIDDEIALNRWFDELAESIARPLLLAGWSLGGMVATRFAARHPEKISALVLLASNPAFIVKEDWSAAMPAETFEKFQRGFEAAPEETLKRFVSLCSQGAGERKTLLRALRDVQLPESPAMAGGLKALAQWDLRKELVELPLPVVHLLSGNDALVPDVLAQNLEALVPQHCVYTFEHKSHALPVEAAGQLALVLNDVLTSHSLASMDHTAVARSFGAAAASYDSAAHLQRRVADTLRDRLVARSPGLSECDAVLDIGCGTGYSSEILQEQIGADAKTKLLVTDLSDAMLQQARRQRSAACSLSFASDAETIALQDASIDTVFSSLALQWTQLQHSLSECARVLKPRGQLQFSTLGPRTLYELRAAWREVDNFEHVNRFFSADYIRQILESCGFQDIEIISEEIRLYYDDYRAMASELKALGAHNVNAARPSGLAGRQGLMRLLRALEQRRTPQGLPATYEVFYVSARKG